MEGSLTHERLFERRGLLSRGGVKQSIISASGDTAPEDGAATRFKRPPLPMPRQQAPAVQNLKLPYKPIFRVGAGGLGDTSAANSDDDANYHTDVSSDHTYHTAGSVDHNAAARDSKASPGRAVRHSDDKKFQRPRRHQPLVVHESLDLDLDF